MSKRIAQMDDDQRRRFELFRSPHCKIPHKKVKEILRASSRASRSRKLRRGWPRSPSNSSSPNLSRPPSR
jgi:hypothetical protein